MDKDVVGVILAGGESRRMGRDKAFLEVGGVSLIQRVIEVLRPIFPEIAVVSKAPGKFSGVADVRLVQDLFPEQHALGGIYSALFAFPGKSCFVFACDLPFLNPSLIRAMIQRLNGYDLLMPQSRHGLEPLHALYTQRCRERMAQKISQGRWDLEGLVRETHSGIVGPEILHPYDPQELSFLNLNTPQQLQQAQAI